MIAPRFLKQAGRGRRTENYCLLRRNLESRFFSTLDQGVEYEQNLKGRALGVILVSARSSRLADLLPRIPAVLTALRSVRAGQLVRVTE